MFVEEPIIRADGGFSEILEARGRRKKSKEKSKSSKRADIKKVARFGVVPSYPTILIGVVTNSWHKFIEFIDSKNSELANELRKQYEDELLEVEETINNAINDKKEGVYYGDRGNVFYNTIYDDFYYIKSVNPTYRSKVVKIYSRQKTYADNREKIVNFIKSLSAEDLKKFLEQVNAPYYAFYSSVFSGTAQDNISKKPFISEKHWYSEGEEYEQAESRNNYAETNIGNDSKKTKNKQLLFMGLGAAAIFILGLYIGRASYAD